MNAVDANVLVYACDDGEPVKKAQALQLFDELMKQPQETVYLWQALAEFLAQLRKWEAKGKLTSAEFVFDKFLPLFDLCHPNERLFSFSFELTKRFSVSHWDSMLLAACKEAGVSVLYSEDFDAGTDYDGVRVVNPFV
jgi:predicted nucleic acid-binding protein